MYKRENTGILPIKIFVLYYTIHLHIYACVRPGRKMHTLTGLTACGGEWEAASCSTLSPVTGHWLPWAGQLAPRYHHVSWASPRGLLLICGTSPRCKLPRTRLQNTELLPHTGDGNGGIPISGFPIKTLLRHFAKNCDANTNTITDGWLLRIYAIYAIYANLTNDN